MTLRNLYKKSYWQLSGPTFYQLHLLFDKPFEEQSDLVDIIAEHVQVLGSVTGAMASDVAEVTQTERPPRGPGAGRIELSRLLDAHQVLIRQCPTLAPRASTLAYDGANDLVVSHVL